MGILKDSLKVVNEIVTLGGASRLEESKRAYQETYDGYLGLYKKAEGYKREVEENVKAIGLALTEAKAYLEKSEKLIEPSVRDKGGLNVGYRMQALDKVGRFNSGFNSAINVGAGSIAGGSMAVGSWALVTALGSASTGAAISGLSGVAATNATLAWFGGGALAAGGAGMAGGAAVLGGLFAIPLVYFAAKGSHKRAKELEEAKTELEETIVRIREQIVAFPDILADAKDKKRQTSKLCKDFITDVIKYSGDIRPYGIFSAAKQKLRSLVGKDPYTREQAEALERLTQSVTGFLAELGIRAGA
ncbi:hypothetical protein [Stigmatella hybrida]|uniref:hypothetical protein n=1 Tax=Stigmatella hybrida TaxID=394097 RepID=UPI001CDAAF54|nr:hypothetical protein [Stigmatella hybrida]